MTPRERFESYVYPDPNSGCHLFFGDWNGDDYGRMWYAGKQELAHRLAWLFSGRELSVGLCVLHKCDTPCCVNVDHLYAGTRLHYGRDMARRWRGRRSKANLPFGVYRAREKFAACIWAGRKVYLGVFATAAEAGAVAVAAKVSLKRGSA
jgi:hypothetical protein